MPHAEVDAGPLHRRGKLRERGRLERQQLLEAERLARLVGRQQGQRDLRCQTLLAPQARPERGVDDGFNRPGVRAPGAS